MLATGMVTPSATRTSTDFPSVFAASFGIGAFGLALGLTYPLLTLLLAQRGVPAHVIGLNAAAMGVGVALSTLVMTRLTARFNAGLLITVGLLGSAVMILAFGFTDNIAIWFALRVVLGFNVNAVFVLTEAWINEASTDDFRGRAVSGYGMALTGGFALGPLGIPLLGTQSALPFAVCAVFVSMTAIAIALLSRRAKAQVGSAPRGSLQKFVFAAPLLIFMVMAFGFADWTMISMMPIYFLEKGMSASLSSTTVSVVHLGMILCALPTGLALDRMVRMRVGALCAAGAMAGFALMPVLSPDHWSIWIALLLLGGCLGGVYATALTLLGERFSGGMLVAGSTVFSMAFTLAGTLGMIGSGVAMEAIGHETVPVSFAICFALLLLIILRSASQPRQPNC